MGSIGTFSSSSVLNNDPANINGVGIGSIVGSPFYFFSNPNNCYKVIYTVGNPCGSQQSTGYFTNTNSSCRTGVLTENSSNTISIFPNPVKDKASLSFTLSDKRPVTLKLIDTKGKEYVILNNEELGEGNHTQEIDLSTLPDGIYIYHLETDKITSGKIVKIG